VGFIGSNLAEALLKAGHQVRVLDNLSTGKREMFGTSIRVGKPCKRLEYPLNFYLNLDMMELLQKQNRLGESFDGG